MKKEYSTLIKKTNKHFYVYIVDERKVPVLGCSTKNKIVQSLYKKYSSKRFSKIYCLSKVISIMIKTRNIRKINFITGKYRFKCKVKALLNYLLSNDISINFKK
ncbi:50S ribosomal protein L18 [Candidatus Vidania fulgoroideae]|nr:50S ribosomal protein L18 [Candidatus Vidania fulgoroideae]